MIVFIDATVEQLRQQAREFNWNRPTCGCGCEKVWGHGFVSRILDDSRVELKRFLCPNCGTVFTLRPSGFFPRIQTCILSVFIALRLKLTTGHWPQPARRQRTGHWMRRFDLLAAGHFPTETLTSLLERLYASRLFFFN